MSAPQSLNTWLSTIATAAALSVGAIVMDSRDDITALTERVANMQKDRLAKVELRADGHDEDILAIQLRNAAWDANWPDLGEKLREIAEDLRRRMPAANRPSPVRTRALAPLEEALMERMAEEATE